MAAQSSEAKSHLNIPSSRMPRSSSHESFATDVSLLSLSSFASEKPSTTQAQDQDQDSRSSANDQAVTTMNPREDLDLDFDNEREMARFREDIFEKMLESHSLSLPKFKSRQSKSPGSGKSSTSNTSKFAETLNDTAYFTPFLTLSQEDLLKKCAEIDPKIRGSLYKSFSTSDVPCKSALSMFVDADEAAAKYRATSQICIPGDYVQILRCRKKHLKSYGNPPTSANDDFQYCKEYLQTPTESADSSNNVADNLASAASYKTSAAAAAHSNCRQPGGNKNAGANKLSMVPVDSRRSTLPVVGVFLKKLKFSKEMGRRIRDDLLRKLSKRKQTQRHVTKLDLDSDKGRPLSKHERNFMIFHWLQSLNEESFDEP